MAGATLGCLARRLDAGGAGQVDVHEHDVGGVFPECRERFFGGAGAARNLDFGQGREQPGQAVTEDGVVIDDQDPGHAGTAGALDTCAGAVTTGSRACTVTPGEASLTLTVPPSSSARSRMMARPLP